MLNFPLIILTRSRDGRAGGEHEIEWHRIVFLSEDQMLQYDSHPIVEKLHHDAMGAEYWQVGSADPSVKWVREQLCLAILVLGGARHRGKIVDPANDHDSRWGKAAIAIRLDVCDHVAVADHPAKPDADSSAWLDRECQLCKVPLAVIEQCEQHDRGVEFDRKVKLHTIAKRAGVPPGILSEAIAKTTDAVPCWKGHAFVDDGPWQVCSACGLKISTHNADEPERYVVDPGPARPVGFGVPMIERTARIVESVDRIVDRAAGKILVHADGGRCHGAMIVDGKCSMCGVAPDAQSTMMMSPTSSEVGTTKECDDLRRRRREAEDARSREVGKMYGADRDFSGDPPSGRS